MEAGQPEEEEIAPGNAGGDCPPRFTAFLGANHSIRSRQDASVARRGSEPMDAAGTGIGFLPLHNLPSKR